MRKFQQCALLATALDWSTMLWQVCLSVPGRSQSQVICLFRGNVTIDPQEVMVHDLSYKIGKENSRNQLLVGWTNFWSLLKEPKCAAHKAKGDRNTPWYLFSP
jgi:hypothetical protein